MHAIYNKNATLVILHRTKPLAGWLLLFLIIFAKNVLVCIKIRSLIITCPHYHDAFSLTNKIFNDSAISKRFDGYCYAISLEKSRLGRRIHAYGTGREARDVFVNVRSSYIHTTKKDYNTAVHTRGHTYTHTHSRMERAEAHLTLSWQWRRFILDVSPIECHDPF